MMNMKVATGSLALTALLFGMSGTADARGTRVQVSIDKGGVQFGPVARPSPPRVRACAS
jgi:hypothetical protein